MQKDQQVKLQECFKMLTDVRVCMDLNREDRKVVEQELDTKIDTLCNRAYATEQSMRDQVDRMYLAKEQLENFI